MDSETQYFINENEEKKVKHLFEQKKANREALLQQQTLSKVEEEKKSLSKLYEQIKVGNVGKLKNLRTEQYIAEEKALALPKPLPKLNENHELPSNDGQWEPVTFGDIVRRCPQVDINNIYTVVHGAIQQPETPKVLGSDQGAKICIKASQNGELFRLVSDEDPRTFADPKPTNVVDNAKKKLTRLPAVVNPSAYSLSQSVPAAEDFPISEQLEYTEETVREKVKEEEEVANVFELDSIFTKNELALLTEETVSIKTLSSLLYSAQKKLNITNESKYEKVADIISTVIAESLLSKKESFPIAKFIKKVTKN